VSGLEDLTVGARSQKVRELVLADDASGGGLAGRRPFFHGV
jgi:hypothetical protein